jgi:hypothetical protein
LDIAEITYLYNTHCWIARPYDSGGAGPKEDVKRLLFFFDCGKSFHFGTVRIKKKVSMSRGVRDA